MPKMDKLKFDSDDDSSSDSSSSDDFNALDYKAQSMSNGPKSTNTANNENFEDEHKEK